jgi:hypothetical protein
MTKEDIIRMAREAGGTISELTMMWSLERFAKIVAAAEREACADICDSEASIEGIAQKCAAAIRARGAP